MNLCRALWPLLLVTVAPLPSHSLPPLPDFSRQACYGDLGCFRNGGKFFHPIHRPIVLLPQSPEAISTRFKLFTRKNPDTATSIEHNDADTMKRSHFNGRLRTILVIHGFTGKDDEPWMNSIRKALLEKFDCNVIQVGWPGIALGTGSMTIYMQATSNTRVVGAVVARMLVWLETKYGLQRDSTHIIGFSLGAQVAGYAGERMRQSGPAIARITGLDPAGPYFEGTDPIVRLDPTDAKFVDVVHTDAGHLNVGAPVLNGGLGMDSSVGHVDFFVNGGHHQPGCLPISIACDHVRAPNLFVATIRNSNPTAFAAFPCSSYENFLAGTCGSACPRGGCVTMGYHASLQQSRFRLGSAQPHFLLTGAAAPFALMHFHAAVRLSGSSPSSRMGELHLRLRRASGGSGGGCWPQGRQRKIHFLKPGSVQQVVFACDWPAGETVSALSVNWVDRGLITGIFGNRKIQVDRVTLTEMTPGRSRSYCGFGSIATGTYVQGKEC